MLSVTTTPQPQQAHPSGDELLRAQKAEISNEQQPISSTDDSTDGRFDESLLFDNSTTNSESPTNDDHHRQKQTNNDQCSRAVHKTQGTTGKASVAKKARRSKGAVKRKDGRYHVCVELGKKPDGRRNRKYFYGDTASQAYALAEDFKAKQRLGVINQDERLTVRKFATIWIETTASVNCKPNTVSGYKDQLNRYVLPVIGNLKLSEVIPSHIDLVLARAADNKLSSGTRRSIRRTMSSMFSAAEKNMLILFNPVKRSTIPARDHESKTRKPKPFTREESRPLLEALSGSDTYSTLFYLMLFTGLRRGEALGLKWSDITEGASGFSVRIERQVQESRVLSQDGVSSVQIEINAPKTMNSIRDVPLEDHVIEKLNSMRSTKLISHTRFASDEYIFQSETNTNLWPSNVTYRWSKFLRDSGIRHMQLHGLRHTFATLTLESGTPLEAVTETLGHSSLSITKDLYASRVTGSAKKATSGISTLLEPNIPRQGVRGFRSL